ncbi:hypothetical protein [Paracoccus sp. JM45]|uniref:hypothetical protein n=1 Tax=Paracoccus sp. JM45 TaxID=2283626 RepID=UPI000E6D27AC|nr:hypothetical protein [Paracoccus sp. JM45]RJE80450.1 hypothetical protein DWB67_06120 [Paracoccus sp. JM45]
MHGRFPDKNCLFRGLLPEFAPLECASPFSGRIRTAPIFADAVELHMKGAMAAGPAAAARSEV